MTPSSWTSSLQNCETIKVLLMAEKTKKKHATGLGLVVRSLNPDRVQPRAKPASSKPPQNCLATQVLKGLSNSALVTLPASPCVSPFVAVSSSSSSISRRVPKTATHFLRFVVRSEKAGTFCWLCSLACLHHLHRARHGFSGQSYIFVESLEEALLPQ